MLSVLDFRLAKAWTAEPKGEGWTSRLLFRPQTISVFIFLSPCVLPIITSKKQFDPCTIEGQASWTLLGNSPPDPNCVATWFPRSPETKTHLMTPKLIPSSSTARFKSSLLSSEFIIFILLSCLLCGRKQICKYFYIQSILLYIFTYLLIKQKMLKQFCHVFWNYF